MRMFRGYMMAAVLLAASAISVQAQTPVRIVDSADPAAYISAANPLNTTIIGSPNVTAVQSTPLTTNGGHSRLSFSSTATINANVVKATVGRLYGWRISNNSASWRYCRVYNKATAPAPATDAGLIILRLSIAPAGIADYYANAGFAGFAAGIGIACTGAVGDADATALVAADELQVNIFFN